MALWNNLSIRRQQLLQGFGEGLNTFNDPLFIKENELTDCKNINAACYPSIQTRADRKIQTLPASTNTGTMNTIGIRTTTNAGTQIHKALGNTWAYGLKSAVAWTNISTALSATTNYGKIIEFNTQTAKYSILAYSDGTFYNSYWDGTNYSTFASTAAPRSNLYTAHKYRLYGVESDGRTLRYSAQGDITDWTTVEDAGWIDLTDQVGKASAITTFADHVIVWSDKTMYELYGSNWDNYQLVNISNKLGCVSSRAYCECNSKLYWMDYSGLYLYTGGIPRQIAHQAKKYIEGINWDVKTLISAGAVNGKVYFAIPYQSTYINKQIVVDVRLIESGKNTVFMEDINANGFINVDMSLWAYGTTDDRFYDVDSTAKTGFDDTSTGGSTVISWNIESKVIADIGLNSRCGISDIWIQHEGSTTSTLSFGYWDNINNSSVSSTNYTAVGASTDYSAATAYKIRRSKLLLNYNQLQNFDLYKFNISGTGYVKLHGLQLNLYSFGQR